MAGVRVDGLVSFMMRDRFEVEGEPFKQCFHAERCCGRESFVLFGGIASLLFGLLKTFGGSSFASGAALVDGLPRGFYRRGFVGFRWRHPQRWRGVRLLRLEDVVESL